MLDFRRPLRFFWLWIWLGLALGGGCATRPSESVAFLAANPGLPQATLITAVPFVAQKENYCGPASLAMTLAWAGNPQPLDQLGEQMITPGKHGTLSSDILSAGRRQGMLVIPVEGLAALFEEVAAGHPVLVLQNLAFSWYPQWHYAVVVGYNLSAGEIILHSGPWAFTTMSFKEFERNWELADHWAVTVLPRTMLAASADDLSHSLAASILEQMGQRREAEEIYLNILKRWPQSLSALIGLGNTRYAVGDFEGSRHYLARAQHLFPDSKVVQNNLATVETALRAKLLTANRAKDIDKPKD